MIFLIIAIASACHGYGGFRKIYTTLALCVILTGFLWLDGAMWWSALGVPLAWFWRVFLRNGNQADDEMACMRYYENKKWIYCVWQSHYYNPLGLLLGFLIAKYINYGNIPFKIGDDYGERFLDCRRYVEFVSGLLPQASIVWIIYQGILYATK